VTEPLIELVDVDAGYGAREVLRDVSVAIAPGERVAIVGPNGAGKSTLLRLLTGVLAQTRGEVRLGGDPVGSLSRIAVARRIAVVPQVAVLPFSARVEEVVGLGRLPHEDPLRGPRAADRAAIESAIARVGLEDFVGRDVRELSLGERQLVLVGLAVAQAAPVIVLDEPTVHLDIRHQVDVMDLLVDLNRRDGTTVVAVLHDLWLAARYFRRIVVLGGGRVAADGEPATALSPDRIRDVFRVEPWHLTAPWATEPVEAR
jgi:ABC-type cobalamin/Fe3+-siderophores transport system ATPase subunit